MINFFKELECQIKNLMYFSKINKQASEKCYVCKYSLMNIAFYLFLNTRVQGSFTCCFASSPVKYVRSTYEVFWIRKHTFVRNAFKSVPLRFSNASTNFERKRRANSK